MTQRARVSMAIVPVLVSAAVGAGVACAGPLNPPAGPIAPTNKTLAEAEPRTAVNATNTPGSAGAAFVISQPGSYYLTGNVTAASGQCGIEIASGRVTLDLMGFTVSGVAGSLDGIRVSGSARFGMTVRNGTITGWGEDGVDFGNAFSYVAEGLHVDSNTGIGIRGGYNGRVIGCHVRLNLSDGINVGDPSVVESCTAVVNGGAGIRAFAGECVITKCVSEVNNGPGILVTNNCIVTNNECASNAGAGILASSINNRIEGNNIEGGPTGVQVTGLGNLIIRNSVTDAGTSYDIVAGNRYGPIIDIRTGGTPAVSGSSAGGVLATTDPWANFAY